MSEAGWFVTMYMYGKGFESMKIDANNKDAQGWDLVHNKGWQSCKFGHSQMNSRFADRKQPLASMVWNTQGG